MRNKNIIFDLGGIFLSLDYRRTKQSFINLGAKDFFDYFAQANHKGLLRDFEIGKVSAAHFRHEIRRLFSLPHVSDGEIDRAWNAMLLDTVPERIQILFGLKQKYRVFLFSNINEIHEQGVLELFQDHYCYKVFLAKFDRVYYSHRVGFRKPDRESFEKIILENGLIAHDTLFIDDMNDNLVGAKDAGLNAHHLLPGDCLFSALRDHGYLPTHLQK